MSEIVYTHRTKSGKKARIICDNFVGKHNTTIIIAAIFSEIEQREYIVEYNENLRTLGMSTYDDLIEYSFWNDVAIDTPILVRSHENGEWLKRHFLKYKNGMVYAFYDGKTSWSNHDDTLATAWNYAKLLEKE
jgi:hypothetical protein